MRTRPRKDFRDFPPVADILIFQLLHRRAGDYHAVVLLLTHLAKVEIEHHHVLDRRILRRMTTELHKADLQLEGGIRQQTDKVGLCRNLQRHQVENGNLQRTDVLRMGAGIIHHEDVLLLQQVYGRKPVG